MQIIIISPNNKTHKHWHLSRTKLMVLSGLILSLLAISTLSIMRYMEAPSQIQTKAHLTQSKITPLKLNHDTFSERNTTVDTIYAKRLGQLQAEAIRLKALTEKLASMSGLDVTDYILSANSAQGGIDDRGEELSIDDFDDGLQQLSLGFEQHHQQLITLQDLIITHDNIESAIPQVDQ